MFVEGSDLYDLFRHFVPVMFVDGSDLYDLFRHCVSVSAG